MTTYFIATNSAPSPQHRGVTFDGASRFLDEMEQPGLTVDQVMAAYDRLYADSAPVAVSALQRFSATSAPQDDPDFIVTVTGKRIPRAQIERLFTFRASAELSRGLHVDGVVVIGADELAKAVNTKRPVFDGKAMDRFNRRAK